ncbi:hypothetical protein [Clostridium sp. Marseille-P2415]|uniref:hypothetical protein n=1 Tax=Clostridium sp. Marseille-P2415 TaxID=1805471 RepID=UPI0009883D95|nr:hypothetical protein [Clostridium sp. Marseille-P2415]
MEKNKRRIRIVFWIAVIIVSASLGVFTAAFDLNASAKKVLIVIYLSIVALTSIAIDLMWYRKFNQKLRSLQSVLLQEHDADRYISEINALLMGKKSPQICSILKLNLCAAYCEKKDYSTAKELLLQINPRKLAGINKFVYWADLAYVHFYLHEDEKAVLILTQQKTPFSKLSDHTHLGGLINILLIFQMLAEGDKTGARQLLEKARPQWENEHTAPDFEYLDKLC